MLTAIVLPPIPTEGLTAADVDKLTLDTREKMLTALEEFAKDPGSKAVLKASAKKVL
jgi:lysophosphatidate acyltransferase